MSRDNVYKIVTPTLEDISESKEISLSGNGDQYASLPSPSRGFATYQVSNADDDLSGALTINLQMSNDGINWIQATDANGDNITHSLASGSSVMEKLSDVNPFVGLRLAFPTAVTGTLSVFVRV